MTKNLSKRTVAVVIIAIVLAALAALSPVLLNPRSQKQVTENTVAVARSSETDQQANTASAKAENTADENSDSQASTDKPNSNNTAAAPSSLQNQSVPDNDIPADGSSPSASTESSSQASDASSTKSTTAAPDNDIKAE